MSVVFPDPAFRTCLADWRRVTLLGRRMFVPTTQSHALISPALHSMLLRGPLLKEGACRRTAFGGRWALRIQRRSACGIDLTRGGCALMPRTKLMRAVFDDGEVQVGRECVGIERDELDKGIFLRGRYDGGELRGAVSVNAGSPAEAKVR